jgi:hypothetical protein
MIGPRGALVKQATRTAPRSIGLACGAPIFTEDCHYWRPIRSAM